MKHISTAPNQNRRPTTLAFTLIELLVVIAIIALIAGMVVGLAGHAGAVRRISATQSDLQHITMAIEKYHSDFSTYPPDNTNDATHPPLYYELVGATFDPNNPAAINYSTKSGASISRVQYTKAFSRAGIANSRPAGGEENPQNVIGLVSPREFSSNIVVGVPEAILLTAPVEAVANGFANQNPWRYVRTNPTNNHDGYDLWVDIYVGGKVQRIANWNK